MNGNVNVKFHIQVEMKKSDNHNVTVVTTAAMTLMI